MKTPSEAKVISPNTVQARRSTPSVPAVIEYKKMRFMIMDRPTNANIKNYIEVWLAEGNSDGRFVVTFYNFFGCEIRHLLRLRFDILCLKQELKRRDVHEVVRVCEPTYHVEPLRKEGINVLVGYNYHDVKTLVRVIRC